ncbi:MAG: hypothetical protein JJT77_03450 [Crocinitomicaceae bacterium]|nr:hypothetical protein [Crocinitomicaceae bacterium]
MPVLVLLLCLLYSCNQGIKNSEVEQNEVDVKDELYHFESFSLVPFGINAFLFLPDETANIGVTEPSVKHEMDSFKWLISLSKDFVLRIDDWGQDDGITVQKRIMEDNKKIFDIEVISSTETVLAYKQMVQTYDEEQKEDKALYFYFHNHKIDGINYVFGTLPTGAPIETFDYIKTSAASVEEVIIAK